MRIAVWHNLPSGGGKRALYYHVRGLVERGHEVICWSLDTADQQYLPLSELTIEHVVPLVNNGHQRNQLKRKLAPDYYKSLDQLVAFDQACMRCGQEIQAGGFDVLFANSSSLFSVPFILRHLQIPKVLYLQEPSRFLYEASPILPWVSHASEDLQSASLFAARELVRDYA